MTFQTRHLFYSLVLLAGLLAFLGGYRCAIGLVSTCPTNSGSEIKPATEVESLEQEIAFDPSPSAPLALKSEVPAVSLDIKQSPVGQRGDSSNSVLPNKNETKPKAEPKPAAQQIAFDLPPSAPLASAIEVSLASLDIEHLAVGQRDGRNNSVPPVRIKVTKEGGFPKARIVPQLLGSVDFMLIATFKDGSYSRQDFSVTVTKPVLQPLEFRADRNNFHKIILGEVGDTYEFSPIARYAVTGAASPGSEVEVKVNDYVTYRHTGASDPSVVRLEEDGTLTALHPGMAEIEARYGSSLDVVSVSVGPNY